MKNFSSYSADIVKYLQRKGMTLKEIGDLMDLSEPYISCVKKGSKRLTLDRLRMLEEALHTPLPLILLQSIDITPNDMPKSMKTQYMKLKNALIISKRLDRL